MVQWPQSLIREIAERRVLFFVGAGLSKTAHANLPSWGSLLAALSNRLPKKTDQKLVKQLVRQGRMLDAAQVLSDGLDKAEFSATMREIFQIRPIPDNEVYEDILMMDPKTIVTTNYDEFLERNLEHYSAGHEAHSVCKHGSKNLLTDLRSPIRSIIKMHGCITDPSNLVLDRVTYFQARRENPGLFSSIAALMTVNTVLFLGYSISDPDIQLILENINLHSESAHSHYALMSKFEHPAIRTSLKKTHNISFLEYPTGEHGQVPISIRDFRNGVKDLRDARGIV